jgi:hypothetical protein
MLLSFFNYDRTLIREGPFLIVREIMTMSVQNIYSPFDFLFY